MRWSSGLVYIPQYVSYFSFINSMKRKYEFALPYDLAKQLYNGAERRYNTSAFGNIRFASIDGGARVVVKKFSQSRAK